MQSSTSTLRTILAESLALTSGHKKCQLSTDWNASRTTSDSAGMASTVKFPEGQVSPSKIWICGLGTANFVNRKRTVNVIETAEAENER